MPLSGQRIGPLSFVPAEPDDAADIVMVAALSGSSVGTHVHLANAYSIALADRDPDVRAVLTGDALNFADGKPLGWYSAIRGHRPAVRQVRGPQLFRDVFDRGRPSGLKHFLLGSTAETLALLESAIRDRFPGANIVGRISPPFRALSLAEIAEQDREIARSGAQIVWVGLGTPKQDFEVARLATALPVVAVAIGAAFDFVAGTVAESPPWIGKIGFEWLYRLCKEPKRLWRRYLFGNFHFIWAIKRHWSAK